jgi:hypothetical protein
MGNQYFWWASKVWDPGCPQEQLHHFWIAETLWSGLLKYPFKWPTQESNRTETWSVRSYNLGVQSFRSIALAVTKHAMFMDDDGQHVIVKAHRRRAKKGRASSLLCYSHTVFDAAILRLMTSVHSKLSRSCQYALLKTTSQRHWISNVRHDPGYGLDAVTT